MSRDHRSELSPALVIAFISLLISLSGVAWAATKITTKDISRGAVTTPKLDRQAVTSQKLGKHTVKSNRLADGAVTSSALSLEASGVALAGVKVSANGEILSSFSRYPGPPQVERFAPGRYNVLPIDDEAPFQPETGRELQMAAISDERGGEITTFPEFSSCCIVQKVFTFDSDGNPADRAFNFLIYAAGPDT